MHKRKRNQWVNGGNKRVIHPPSKKKLHKSNHRLSFGKLVANLGGIGKYCPNGWMDGWIYVIRNQESLGNETRSQPHHLKNDWDAHAEGRYMDEGGKKSWGAEHVDKAFDI